MIHSTMLLMLVVYIRISVCIHVAGAIATDRSSFFEHDLELPSKVDADRYLSQHSSEQHTDQRRTSGIVGTLSAVWLDAAQESDATESHARKCKDAESGMIVELQYPCTWLPGKWKSKKKSSHSWSDYEYKGKKDKYKTPYCTQEDLAICMPSPTAPSPDPTPKETPTPNAQTPSDPPQTRPEEPDPYCTQIAAGTGQRGTYTEEFMIEVSLYSEATMVDADLTTFQSIVQAFSARAVNCRVDTKTVLADMQKVRYLPEERDVETISVKKYEVMGTEEGGRSGMTKGRCFIFIAHLAV